MGVGVGGAGAGNAPVASLPIETRTSMSGRAGGRVMHATARNVLI